MLQCAFIGVLDAVAGPEAFVFVTAVDFTSTSLVQHQPANCVIVEMEEVRKKRKTRQANTKIGKLVKTVKDKDPTKTHLIYLSGFIKTMR